MSTQPIVSSDSDRIYGSLCSLAADNSFLVERLRGLSTHTELGSMAQRLLSSLRGVPQAYLSLAGLPVESRLTALVQQSGWNFSNYNGDVVLALSVISRIAPQHFFQLLTDSAICTFAQRYPTYVAILGDFIPPQLHRQGLQEYRWMLYDEPRAMNFSAIDDVSVYRAGLAHRISQQGGCIGLPTAFVDLDRQFGGLVGTTILGGPPGVGKTDLCLQLTVNLLRSKTDVCVLFHEFDVAKNAVFDRLVCNLGQVTEVELMANSLAQHRQTAIEQGFDSLEQIRSRLHIVHHLPQSPIDIDQMIKQRNAFVSANQCR